jgi:hypothetical protein
VAQKLRPFSSLLMTLPLFLLSVAFVPLFSSTQGSYDLAAPLFGS